MGALELRRLLGRRLLQHQHVDDQLLHDCERLVLVAVVVMRLAGLRPRRLLRLPDRSHRCHLPYRLSCRQQSFFRYLGLSVAGV